MLHLENIFRRAGCLLAAAALCLTAGCMSPAASVQTAGQELTDQDLVNRAMYLLDPYLLPVSWWTGTGYELLRPLASEQYTIQPDPDAPPYAQVSRFSSLEEMKQLTEQMVTTAYAETWLYPQGEQWFYEQDGRLYISCLATSGGWSFTPAAASVTQRTETSAELEVSFYTEDDTRFTLPIELQLEDQTWKLASTPFQTAVAAPAGDEQPAAVPTDEELINRLTGLFDQYVYPVAWYMASGDTALGVSELGRPLESDDPNVTYFEVTRFSELWKMKRATEQVFTREYAERVLYPYLTEEKEDFIEYDGKLYRNTSIIGSGWYTDTDRMEVLHKDQTSAEIEVDFRYIDEVTTGTVTMQKENGLWKIASLPNHLAPTLGRQ